MIAGLPLTDAAEGHIQLHVDQAHVIQRHVLLPFLLLLPLLLLRVAAAVGQAAAVTCRQRLARLAAPRHGGRLQALFGTLLGRGGVQVELLLIHAFAVIGATWLGLGWRLWSCPRHRCCCCCHLFLSRLSSLVALPAEHCVGAHESDQWQRRRLTVVRWQLGQRQCLHKRVGLTRGRIIHVAHLERVSATHHHLQIPWPAATA